MSLEHKKSWSKITQHQVRPTHNLQLDDLAVKFHSPDFLQDTEDISCLLEQE